MATYRPKSLDELNEFYDKAKSAEQAFQKGKSLLKEESINIETEFPIIDTTLSDLQFDKKLTQHDAPKSNDEVLTDVNSILGSLMPDEKDDAEDEPIKQEQIIYKSEDAPIKGKELSGLMDDYVKVMTDIDYYDEDEEFEDSKKDKKRRKTKKRTKFIEDTSDEFADDGEPPEADNDEPESAEITEPQPVDDDKAADEKATEFSISPPPYESEYPDIAPQPKRPERKSEEVYSETAEKKNKRKSVASTVTSVLLVLVFIATVIVGTINMTLKVNTGLTAFKSFYFFTTSQSHPAIGIKSGDFVVCKRQTNFEDGTSVAYIDRTSGTFSFGIKSETSNSRDDYGNQLYVISGTSVKQSDVIGEIKSDIPFLGKIIGGVLDNYLAVLAALVLLAVILTLIRCFAFNDKDANNGKGKNKNKNQGKNKSKSKKKNQNKNKTQRSVKPKTKTNDIFSDVWPDEADEYPEGDFDPDNEYGSDDND